jgi:hypothetical protein
MELAMACRIIVFPVRGGATIKPRCPLPTGAIRSRTRDDMFEVSSLIRLSG